MESRWRGYSVLLGCILVQITLGTLYTFGNMNPYITSYLRHLHKDNDLTYSRSIWILASAAMGPGISMFFGGFLYSKLGPQLTTLAGSWISRSGFHDLIDCLIDINETNQDGCFTVVSVLMDSRWRGYSVVVGCILVHITLGTVYTFGNMTPYITSYLRQLHVDNDLTYSQSIWIFSLAAMGQGASMFVGGFLYPKLGPQLTTLVGAWISSGGVALTYFTVQKSFTLVVVTYGLMFGLGVGIAYAVPLNCGQKWFPNHKGLVSGLVVAGFGSGAFIFDQVQTAYINPDNKEADSKVGGDKYFTQESILHKVPESFLLLGGCYAVIQVIGCLLLMDPPIEYKQLPQEIEDDPEHEFESPPVENVLTWREAIKTKAFFQLWFIYLFNGQGIQFVSGLYKAYGQTFIKDDHFLAIVGSLAAVFNGCGRIMWGYIADRYTFRIAMMGSCASFAALTLSFGLTSIAGKGLFLVFVCLLFLCFSGNFSLLPTATSKSFGQAQYPIIYGLVFTASVITSPIGAILSENLKSVIGWYGMYFLCAAFSLTSVVIAYKFDVKTSNGQHI